MNKCLIVLSAITCCYAAACSSSKNVTASSNVRMPAQFSYLPPSKSAIASTGLTISLIRPAFINLNAQNYVDPFPQMASSMANDFNQLLTAKGFRVQGPFQNIGAMTYTEQQNSDFCFKVDILTEPVVTANPPRLHTGFTIYSPTYYLTSGQIYFAGKFHIEALSPHGVLLWQKDILLDPVTVSYTGTTHWTMPPQSLGDQMNKDNGIYNLVTAQLEKYYSNALEMAWQQIDPAEMQIVAKQAKEADKHSN
jgi:hypothetical protein